MKTYISLFSSAGVGCYGFKLEGFECIATNEIIERRLNIQKSNRKCKYGSGYICGDITLPETKNMLYSEIEMWKKQEHIKQVDVVIATPPCQGMSVANHKKNDTEKVRNSLVIESIKIIKTIKPKFFVFENVPAFMKTVCTDIDGYDKPIADAISSNLGNDYSYTFRIINFKNYGACSSRSRTVVIGVSKDYADEISPFELYPTIKPEKTLREVIGSLKPLKRFGEIDPQDIFHSFRTYPKHMRTWISNLKEGESAFDNKDDNKKPHQIIDGKIVINQQKNADKYKRQFWDKVGPCVHTRNDQLASQNTIHPSDDRVFSIRELMRMMTVPDSFKWSDEDLSTLNSLSLTKKRAYLKREEIKIRQSLGEAVPTIIFEEIAQNIANALTHQQLNSASINKVVANYKLNSSEKLISFVESNPLNLSISALSRIAELSNTRRTDDAAFYTNKSLITEMVKNLPDFEKEEISILEPSVGVGNFIPLILKKYEGKKLKIDLVDIDENSIRLASLLLNKYGLPKNCEIHYIVDNFLTHKFDKKYDLIIGNPPFFKLKSNDNALREYRKFAINKDSTNICSFFLDKAMSLGGYVSLVFPKFILNTPEFASSRSYLSQKSVECIIDFGEKGFPGVLIETLALFINNQNKPKQTRIISVTKNINLMQNQKYIFDPSFPCWIIYRNDLFDTVCQKLDFDRFTVFRDRQITNDTMTTNGGIRVIKSRNISDDGKGIITVDGYDSYICNEVAKKLSVYEFLERDDVYLTPNMTYKPRVIQKPKGTLVNGSVAILLPKIQLKLSEKQCGYFSTDEYRQFYQIARNYQTRSLNVDACSVFFYGILRETTETDIDEIPTGKSTYLKGGSMMLTEKDIADFCASKNYDLRISGNGRWIDQKCAADVVTVVADCILNYGLEHADDYFTTKDVWYNHYTVENVEAIFSKPGVERLEAKNEYDKFFQQPMEMLAYAGVLNKEKRGNKNFYKIANYNILEYIALRERNALTFLKNYIEKVLKDSDIYYLFKAFFDLQNKASYNDMKDGFTKFIIDNTKINGPVECHRIFIKVLNPLAYFARSCGTEKGRLSGNPITYDMLMYNRNNFRDIYANKPKGTTRKEYTAKHPVEVNEAYYHYQSTKAKRYLKLFNDQNRDGITEYLDGVHEQDKATQIHHIFPESEYPEICYFLENLIALTPTQHMNYAHPEHKTTEINEQYQQLLLLAKADRIRENLTAIGTEKIYDFSNLLTVLKVGFDNDDVLEIANMDFGAVVNAINIHYA